MSVNGISGVSSIQEATQVKSKANATSESATGSDKIDQNTKSAVYEKGSDQVEKKKEYKQDTATIALLKADSEKRTQQLRDLVEKMMLKQGQTFIDTNMYQLLREGKVPVDAETAAKAKEDIAEDGYWGVNQTSDRLVSFAKALTGGDPSKADEMIEAVKKGFNEATKAWGGTLPAISQQTLDATLKKLDEWKNSLG